MFMPRFFSTLGLSFALSLLMFNTQTAHAQILSAEGVAGDMDSKSRGPVLSVSANVESNKVTILADASNPRDEFNKYPIQFDFFVNRQFITSQYRSPTLPGPIALEVSNKIATPPFNYVVVAKVLYPNSVYTSVIEAAVYTQSLAATLDCTLTSTPKDGKETIYTAQKVVATQSGNSVFTTAFEATSENGEDTINVSATITVASKSADSTGSVVIVDQDGNSTTSNGNVVVEKTATELTSFAYTSSDDVTTLSCS
jgi:hypothetical protein